MATDVLHQDLHASARHDAHPLDVFFNPSSVVIFGASEEQGSPGRTLMLNLLRNPFGGVLFPISSRRSLLGIEAYPHVGAVPEPIELAVVLASAPEVPAILDQCALTGVKAALILSTGSASASSADDLLFPSHKQHRHSSMRILGPNSHGIACPRSGFNATFSPARILPGNVGLLSQDGDLLTASLGQERPEYAGCSVFVSLGKAVDVSWAEWIDYLDRDAQTECISIYLETLDDPRTFFAAVRDVASRKPILLVKSGDIATSARGSSRDEVFDEACRCNGVLRVRRVADLFCMAHLLTTQPPARGRRLTIVTNAHGPGVAAADRLHASGGQLASLAPETVAALRGVLPSGWNGQNPIEIDETGNAVQFTNAARVASRDPGTDALLVLLAPQMGINPLQAADALRIAVQDRTRPVLACWLWDAANPQSLAIFREAEIPVFSSPEAAMNVFDDLCRHTENLRYLSDISAALADAREHESALARPCASVSQARSHDCAEMTLADCHQLFSAYALPVLVTRSVSKEDEAVAAAEVMGYPVQISLAKEPWLSEGNEIRLTAGDNAAVRQAVHTLTRIAREHFGAKEPPAVMVSPVVAGESCAVAVRGITHPHLGPVLEFGEAGPRGSGPRYPVITLPPLLPLTARELIVQSPALAVFRSRATDLDALATFLVNFSRLLVEQRGIKEITVNPLQVAVDRVLVLDARVVLHAPDSDEGHWSRSVASALNEAGSVQKSR